MTSSRCVAVFGFSSTDPVEQIGNSSVGRTPAHVTTALRRATGRTAVAWIVAGRMAEARRLLRSDLAIDAIAARIGYADATHFIRMFRRMVGCTPARHVQERRVSRAAELLERTNLTIDEIAERCGFANRFHFSRVFAQRMVEPPGRYRALHGPRAATGTGPAT